MSENESSAPSSAKTDEVRPVQLRVVRRRNGLVLFMPFLAIILVAALFAASWFVRMKMITNASVQPTSTAAVVQLEQRVANIEQQVQAFDGKLNELSERVDKNSAVSVSTEVPSPQSAPQPVVQSAASAAATARMQNDITELSAALATLQAEVKQTGSAAAQTQQTTQSALAAVIAFIQLRESADAGRGFESDLATLRSAAGSNAGIQESLSKLQPYAAKGVPTLGTLRDEFFGLEKPASIAIDKASAQTAWQRLGADLETLVSVRPLHGGAAPDAFASAEAALASGDLGGALEAVKNLPPEAQDIFKDWRAKAEARQEINTDLSAIAGRLVSDAPAAPPPTASAPAQGEP